MAQNHFDTPATYSADEADRIRHAFAQLDVSLECPRCGGILSVGPPILRPGGTIQEVSCPGCRRCLFVRNQPERPATC